MKQKTCLSPIEQWDRTVAYILERDYADYPEDAKIQMWAWETKSKEDWLLGVIMKPTKLFNKGDMVITWGGNNGSADRYQVYGVSSKGYQVAFHYLPYDTATDSSKERPLSSVRDEAWADMPKKTYKNRTMYIPQPPYYLAGRSFIDPLVREYVAALHAGTADELIRTAAAKIQTVFVAPKIISNTGLAVMDPARENGTPYELSYYEAGMDAESRLARDIADWTVRGFKLQLRNSFDEEALKTLQQLNEEGAQITERVRRQLPPSIEVLFKPLEHN